MPDPREVLEREAEDALEAAKARIRAAIEDATRDVLADLDVHAALNEAAGGAPLSERITRTDATRLFGITTSRMRSLEARGLVHARRKGGRIMVDPDEVAEALGVPVPGKAPDVEEYLAERGK